MVELERLIEEGLRHFKIRYDRAAVLDLTRFAEELGKWNRQVNLVGLKDPRSVVTRLLYDAFFIHRLVGESGSLLDMGSGAGILAVPLKVLCKDLKVFSVDKNIKKILFQRHIARILDLKDFTAIHGNIEELEPLRVDVLAAKAFGSTKVILEKGGRHIQRGGRSLIPKTGRDEPVSVEGFVLEEDIPYGLPGSGKPLRIFVYKKIS